MRKPPVALVSQGWSTSPASRGQRREREERGKHKRQKIFAANEGKIAMHEEFHKTAANTIGFPRADVYLKFLQIVFTVFF